MRPTAGLALLLALCSCLLFQPAQAQRRAPILLPPPAVDTLAHRPIDVASLALPELLPAGTTTTRELIGLARPTYDAWLADYQWQTEQLRRGELLDQASQAVQAQSAKVLLQTQQDLATERLASTQTAQQLHTTQRRLQQALAKGRPPLLFDPRLYAGTAAGLVAGLVLSVVLSHP